MIPSTLKPSRKPIGRTVPLKSGGRLKERRYRSVTTRTGKRDQLDGLNREFVWARDRELGCATCGSHHELEVGHFLSRSRWSTRWIPSNTHLQCSPCNQAHEADPEPYRRFMLRAYGQETIDDLERLWHSQEVTRDEQLDELIETYTALMADLKRSNDVSGD